MSDFDSPSSQNAFSFRIVRGAQISASGKSFARDVDFKSAGLDEIRIHTRRIVHIAHCDGSANCVAVGTGSGVTDRLSIAIDRLATPQHRSRILEDKNYELAFQLQLLLF